MSKARDTKENDHSGKAAKSSSNEQGERPINFASNIEQVFSSQHKLHLLRLSADLSLTLALSK